MFVVVFVRLPLVLRLCGRAVERDYGVESAVTRSLLGESARPCLCVLTYLCENDCRLWCLWFCACICFVSCPEVFVRRV